MRNDTFVIQPQHGRVTRPTGPGKRQVVGVPGDEIPMSLAIELGLFDPTPRRKAEAEVAEVEPIETSGDKAEAVEKPAEDKAEVVEKPAKPVIRRYPPTKAKG